MGATQRKFMKWVKAVGGLVLARIRDMQHQMALIFGELILVELLKILEIDYDIQVSNTIRDEEESSGLCEPDLSLIQISSHCSEQVKKVTLLHEVVEAICSQLDIQIKHHYIELLETGLFQVLRDNPEFVEYIMEKNN